MIVLALSRRICRPVSVSPVKATLSTSGCSAKRGADLRARPSQDVDDTVRDSSFETDLSQQNGGDRCGAGWFENDGVARRQCRAELPGGHQQREVPGDDLGADADRLPQRVVEQRAIHRDRLAADMSRQIGVIIEAVRGRCDVAPRFDDDLAAVQRLEAGDLFLPLAQNLGDPAHAFAALIGRHGAPRSVVKRVSRGPDRAIDVLNARLGNAPDNVVVCRIQRVERLTRGGGNELSVNK